MVVVILCSTGGSVQFMRLRDLMLYKVDFTGDLLALWFSVV